MRVPLAERALGKWQNILPLIGVDKSFLSGKHGPCPFCKAGKDRFRFTDHNRAGGWFCNTCGAGDGIEFVKQYFGIEFKNAAEKIEGVIGAAEESQPKERDAKRARADIKRVWESGRHVSRGDLVSQYLAGRRILLESYPPALRFLSDKPASMMLAKVISADGIPVNVHRTFINPDGTKSDQRRLLMPGPMPAGCAVRLFKPTSILGIGEGIETSLSAGIKFNVPVWAALNADNMAKFIPPDGITEMWIFGDNDENHHGQWAAECAARTAHKHKCGVRVMIPEYVGTDWND